MGIKLECDVAGCPSEVPIDYVTAELPDGWAKIIRSIKVSEPAAAQKFAMTVGGQLLEGVQQTEAQVHYRTTRAMVCPRHDLPDTPTDQRLSFEEIEKLAADDPESAVAGIGELVADPIPTD